MLTTYHFLFTAQVVSPLLLDDHSGASLRGNFFEAIWKRFCNNKTSPSCADCPLHSLCPVSALVAPLREENPRGRDIPRPYIILPPLETSHMYAPGEIFTFGITLFGSIIQLLPYLVMSVKGLEENGLGHRLAENGGQRGTFVIKQIEAYHPLSGARHPIYQKGQASVQVPPFSVSESDVVAKASTLSTEKLTLDFMTPTRIIDQDQLVRQLTFRSLALRLKERLRSLHAEYGQDSAMQQSTIPGQQEGSVLAETGEKRQEPDIVHLAASITCQKDATVWEDVKSYSRRQHRFTPVGGFMGQITFVGDLEPFRELLTWGELIHVGKSAVKGNGWYRIIG